MFDPLKYRCDHTPTCCWSWMLIQASLYPERGRGSGWGEVRLPSFLSSLAWWLAAWKHSLCRWRWANQDFPNHPAAFCQLLHQWPRNYFKTYFYFLRAKVLVKQFIQLWPRVFKFRNQSLDMWDNDCCVSKVIGEKNSRLHFQKCFQLKTEVYT